MIQVFFLTRLNVRVQTGFYILLETYSFISKDLILHKPKNKGYSQINAIYNLPVLRNFQMDILRKNKFHVENFLDLEV
jgi:hypothetical protein